MLAPVKQDQQRFHGVKMMGKKLEGWNGGKNTGMMERWFHSKKTGNSRFKYSRQV